MPHVGRAARYSVATLGLFGFGVAGIAVLVGPVSPVSAVGTLIVTPTTNLQNGSVVTVSGSGFVANSIGGMVECNNDPGQPTIAVVGNAVPVSCSDPANALTSTSPAGALSTQSFTIGTGVLGPPAEGTDSAGNDADTDAALYPCPPTAVQIALGDSCDISFGDQGGDQVSQAISFAGTPQTSETTTTSTTPVVTTTTTSGSSSTTTTTGASGVTSTSSGEVASTTTTTTTTTSTEATTTTSTTSTTNATVAATPSMTTTSTAARTSSPLSGVSDEGDLDAVSETIPDAQPLAYTGSGPGLMLLAVSGLCLMYIGFLVMTLKYRPRALTLIAAMWIGRLFGGDERPTNQN